MLIEIRIDAFDFVAVLTGLGLRFCIGIGGAEGTVTSMVWSSDWQHFLQMRTLTRKIARAIRIIAARDLNVQWASPGSR